MINVHLIGKFALVLGLVVGLAACSRKDKDDFMPAEEARIEIRTASQEIRESIDELMNSEAMEVLEYLMELLSEDENNKSGSSGQTGHAKAIDPTLLSRSIGKIVAAGTALSDPGKYNGLYRYNFRSGKFDLVDGQVSYLRYLFPSSQTERTEHTIDAAFTANNLVYQTITKEQDGTAHTEDLFTSAEIDMYIDNQTLLTCSFEASFNDSGMPLSMNFSATVTPFRLQLKLTGSGFNYSSTLQLKKDEAAGNMINFNLSLRYNSDKDDIDRMSGFLQMLDLRFEGNIRAGNIKSCQDSDIACMNENLDVALNHTGHRKKIGDVEYRHHPDGEKEAIQPELHVVYQDGSHELLSDIIEIYPFSFRYDLWRSDRP